MIETTDYHSSQIILDPVAGLEHRRQHAVLTEGEDGPKLVEMRDLIQWFAYRLDSGHEGHVENHTLAVVLRSIADTYYPHMGDLALYLAEEAEEEGVVFALPKVDAPIGEIDPQFLNLEEGFAVLEDSFSETSIGDQERHPMLLENSTDTLDFAFPERAVVTHGIAGIRVSKIDFLSYCSGGRVYHDAYRPLTEVLADYQSQCADEKDAYEQRMKDKYGPDCFDESRTSAPLNSEHANAILEELAGLTC